jgi:hypothetical protein
MPAPLYFLFLATAAHANSPSSSPQTIEANLKAGAEAARAALVRPDDSPAVLKVRAQRDARQQAYLRAEANELAARQLILARLAKAKTNEEAADALAELQDRWQAAKEGLFRLKQDAEAPDHEAEVIVSVESTKG